MSRTSRIISSTDIYHIILRGINQQIIFEENNDYIRFKTILHECCKKYPCMIFGYCLMDNHVHLLVHAPKSELELFFKSLEVSYAIWFNTKYQRSGHLFQNRFFSSPVESAEYLLKTLRYIHYNPVKSGIITHPQEYPWSSCVSYFLGCEDDLLSKKVFFGLTNTSAEPDNTVFCAADEDFICEPVERVRLSDEQGIQLMWKVSGCSSHAQFQKLGKTKRNKSIKILRNKGLSVRQLVRICGISKSTIERILGMKK